MSTRSPRANSALAALSGNTTTRPLLTVSNCETCCSPVKDTCPPSVTNFDEGSRDLLRMVDVASTGGSCRPGGQTVGPITHPPLHPIPQARPHVSPSPPRP